jgi:hypothetical protein
MEREHSVHLYAAHSFLCALTSEALALYISGTELGATSTSSPASTGAQLGTMVQCYFRIHVALGFWHVELFVL